jgi:hypothetical protein
MKDEDIILKDDTEVASGMRKTHEIPLGTERAWAELKDFCKGYRMT